MKRLTTDHPDGNFETVLNFVFSKDGWAYIRHDGERENVPLHEWFKYRCIDRGCDDLPSVSPEELYETLCDCIMWISEDDGKSCPISLAYAFAAQACHLRDRLKRYEDILFDADGTELITLDQLETICAQQKTQKNVPLTVEELREMDGQPVYVVEYGSSEGEWYLVDAAHEKLENKMSVRDFSVLGLLEEAYRHPPEVYDQ